MSTDFKKLLEIGWCAKTRRPHGLDQHWVLTPEGERRRNLFLPLVPGRDAFGLQARDGLPSLAAFLEKEVRTYDERKEALKAEAAWPVASSAVVMGRYDSKLWPARLMTSTERAALIQELKQEG